MIELLILGISIVVVAGLSLWLFPSVSAATLAAASAAVLAGHLARRLFGGGLLLELLVVGAVILMFSTLVGK